MKRLLTIITLLLAVFMLLSACRKEESKSVSTENTAVPNTVEGVWKFVDRKSKPLTKLEKKEIEDGKFVETYTFQNGYLETKAYTVQEDGSTRVLNEYRGTYRIEDNKIITTTEDNKHTYTYKYSINGDTMELASGEQIFILKKQP